MNTNRYCIIMAGGLGSRLWPYSRHELPKQFLDPLGCGRSLLRLSYERFTPIIKPENFIVITLSRFRDLVMEQIPELKPEQILCEPIGRNTAPCICYAAHSLLQRNPEAEVIITPSDHHIEEGELFCREMEEAFNFLAPHPGALLSVGIKPTRPETGYGYIQVSDAENISRVKFFTEKPIAEVAESFVECGEFLWNSGIYLGGVRDIIDTLHRHMPEESALFATATNDYGTPREEESIMQIYSQCRTLSIDKVVMEQADQIYVRVANFKWNDIGTWGLLHEESPKDEALNTKRKENLLHNTHRTILSLPKGKLAVVSGLDDYIIVDTDDVLLICPREQEQGIKQYIDELKYHEEDQYL